MTDQTEPDSDELSRCREANEELKEENDHLRDAAGAFGELAERLNAVLRADRRQEPDRRAQERPEEPELDRRSAAVPS